VTIVATPGKGSELRLGSGEREEYEYNRTG